MKKAGWCTALLVALGAAANLPGRTTTPYCDGIEELEPRDQVCVEAPDTPPAMCYDNTEPDEDGYYVVIEGPLSASMVWTEESRRILTQCHRNPDASDVCFDKNVLCFKLKRRYFGPEWADAQCVGPDSGFCQTVNPLDLPSGSGAVCRARLFDEVIERFYYPTTGCERKNRITFDTPVREDDSLTATEAIER